MRNKEIEDKKEYHQEYYKTYYIKNKEKIDKKNKKWHKKYGRSQCQRLRKRRIKIICNNCKKEFWVIKSRNKKVKFCGKECDIKYRERNKIGVYNPKVRSKAGKIGGKKGAAVNKKNRTGCFFDKDIQSRAGKIGCIKANITNKRNGTGVYDIKVRSMGWGLGAKKADETNRKNKTGFYGLTKEQRKENRAKQIIPVKDTKIEIKIQEFLKQLKLNFLTHQYMRDIEHRYQCDILIPVQEGIIQKTIIECFGTYWHNYPLSRQIDVQRCNELRKKGWKVLVFWENEIKVMELNNLQEVIFR